MLNDFLETTMLYGSGGGKTGKSGEDNPDNTLQSNSILRFVELISEGPCEGLVGSTRAEKGRSILFDKTPLKTKSGGNNFKNVDWRERVGTPDQDVLKGHAGVETPFEVGVRVMKGGAGPVRRTIANPDVDSLLMIMRLPALVEQDDDDGSLKKTDVSYQINIKPEGANWYVAHTENIKNEKATSAYQLVHRIDLPEANSWLVEVQRLTPDSEEEGLANETWWDAYTTRVEGKFTYPHCALIGFDVNAEDMGSQLPQRLYHYRGLKILVPSNYDPIARTYTGFWDGEFKLAWTNKPVWIYYDLLTNDRYALGAQVTNVTMQAVQPPEQVQGAFDDAVKAGQDRARARNEGEAYANQVIPTARGNAFRLLKDAEGYRSMVIENATGNAARFSQVVTEYQKAPAVTRDRMYLDTMQQIFTSASKVLVDAKSGSNLLYLPLDKLIAQTAANDAAIGAKSGPVAMPATPDPMQIVEQVRQRDSRSRESSRDRESR